MRNYVVCHKCGAEIQRKRPNYCPECNATLNPGLPGYDPTSGISAPKEKEKRNGLDTISIILLSMLLGVALVLLVLTLKGCQNDKAITTDTAATTTAVVTTADSTKNVGPVVSNGLNIGSKEMFTVNVGDVVSGDIAIVANDNSKQELYDNDATTADIVVFKKGALVWSEWGCFLARNASEAEIQSLISDKENQAYTVRIIIWPNDLSNLTGTSTESTRCHKQAVVPTPKPKNTCKPTVAPTPKPEPKCTPVPTPKPTPVPTPKPTPIPKIVIPVIHAGLDQPSKSWFLAKAGTLISGDVAIFDNDNNSKKTPVYDSKEGTADIIYLTSDTYIWTEWGCYTIENANAQDVAALINDKLTNGNFTSVRYFNGYSKLGTNVPVIINSKIDASSITLPIKTK